jgi:hypothetical protein
MPPPGSWLDAVEAAQAFGWTTLRRERTHMSRLLLARAPVFETAVVSVITSMIAQIISQRPTGRGSVGYTGNTCHPKSCSDRVFVVKRRIEA